MKEERRNRLGASAIGCVRSTVGCKARLEHYAHFYITKVGNGALPTAHEGKGSRITRGTMWLPLWWRTSDVPASRHRLGPAHNQH